MLRKIVRWIKPVFRRNSKNSKRATEGFYDAKAFLTQLNKEKLRAERSNSEFVLLVLDLQCGLQNNETTECRQCFTSVITECIRESDTKGWYYDTGSGRECIGVILPYTDRSGAVQTVERIESYFADLTARKPCRNGTSPNLSCRIFSYFIGKKPIRKHHEIEQIDTFIQTEKQ